MGRHSDFGGEFAHLRLAARHRDAHRAYLGLFELGEVLGVEYFIDRNFHAAFGGDFCNVNRAGQNKVCAAAHRNGESFRRIFAAVVKPERRKKRHTAVIRGVAYRV